VTLPDFSNVFLRMGGWAALIVAGIGVILLLIGGNDVEKGEVLLANGTSATATITRKSVQSNRRQNGGTSHTYSIEFEFPTARGTQSEKSVVDPRFFDAHPNGGQFTVFFLPEDPSAFEVSTGSTLSLGKTIRFFGIFALVAGIGATAYLTIRARRAFGLLSNGTQVEAKIYEVIHTKNENRLRFGYIIESGETLEKKSFSGNRERVMGLGSVKTIPVYYDPKDPKFAFWRDDLL